MNLEQEVRTSRSSELLPALERAQSQTGSATEVVTEFMSLLEFLAQTMKGTSIHPVINENHIRKLHELLVKEHSDPVLEDMFYQFLTKEVSIGRQERGLLHSMPILIAAFKLLFCS